MTVERRAMVARADTLPYGRLRLVRGGCSTVADRKTAQRNREVELEVEQLVNLRNHPVSTVVFPHDDPYAVPAFVYFVQGVEGGPIKIGNATNVRQRLTDLQMGNPQTLIVLAIIPCFRSGQTDVSWSAGSVPLERDLHNRFSDHRVRGEWFHPAPELMDFLENLRTSKWWPPAEPA